MGQTLAYLIIYIAEAFIAWQYLASIFVSRFKKRICFLAITIGYLLLYLISFKEIYWLNTISFLIINLSCILFLFKTNGKKALFHSLILTIVMNVTELLMMNTLALIFNDFSSYAKELSIFVLLATTSKVLYYFVIQIIMRLFGSQKEHSAKSGSIVALLCSVPIVSIWITVTILFIGIEGNIPNHLSWFISIDAVFILFLNLCVFFIYTLSQQESEKYLQVQLQLQKESTDAKYYKMLLVHDEDQKILIHDFKKHLSAISDLLDNGHTIEVKEYVNRMIQSKELSEKLCFCDNPALNLILMRYKALCAKTAISFFVDIRKDTVSFFNIEDLTSLFGNLLENAVEAAVGIDGSFIELSVKYKESGQLLISMINSCNQVPIQTASGDFVSTKIGKQKHGLGMKSIRKIVKKYNGTLSSFYNEEDLTFHTMIILAVGGSY